MTNKTQIVISAKDETGQAINSAKRGLDSLSVASSKLGDAFGTIGVGGGLVGILGGATLAATVKEAVDSLDKLNESAERVGVTVEDLSALNFAGKMSGLEFEDMTTALTKLSVKMQEAASGGKEAGALFSDLGIKVTDSAGKLKSADAVLSEIADAFSGMEDGAGKTALAVDTFGKSGAKLVPMLNSGASGLEDMRKEAESLGLIIDGKLAKQAADFNDNLDKLAMLSSTVGKNIAGELLPTLNKLTEEMLDGIAAAGGFWAALNAGATLNPFANTAENIATVRADLKKIEDDRVQYGYMDEARYKRKLNQLQMLEAQEKRATTKLAKGLGLDDVESSLPKKTATRTADKSGTSKQIDEALRLIQTLDEQIAVKNVDAESTDKQTQAEQQAIKVRQQLEAGTLKATEAQRQIINDRLDSLVSLDKELAAQKEMTDAVNKQSEANAKNRQSMFDQIAAAEKAADLYGLTESQISVVEQARLADAVAIAKQNGASEEHIAFLEEELRMRGELSAALAGKEGKKNEIEDAADKAQKAISDMDQFAVQAAHNMQDAMAELFIKPTGEGIKGFATSFGQTVQKMIAQAASAQLLKALFGDMGKDGKLGGIVGSVDWAKLFSSSSSSTTSTSSANFSFGSIDGMRANGGPVAAGGTYLVGENGPELLTMGASGGHVTPNSAMGGNVNITVNNQAAGDGYQATASAKKNDAGIDINVLVVKAIQEDQRRNGPITQGFANTFGMSRSAA